MSSADEYCGAYTVTALMEQQGVEECEEWNRIVVALDDFVNRTVSVDAQRDVCEKIFRITSCRFTPAYYAFNCVTKLFAMAVAELYVDHVDPLAQTAFAAVAASFHVAFLHHRCLPDWGLHLALELFNALMYFQMSADIRAMVFLAHDFVEPLRAISKASHPAPAVDAMVETLERMAW